MALILNIETATTVCSVALAQDGNLLSLKEVNEGYTHAENITLFIQYVLRDTGKKIADLDAIAVSGGPGSYTGLRIGISAAKGLCYALEKPLIAISTLRSLAHKILNTQYRIHATYYCSMIDARRMEVYCAVYDEKSNEIEKVSAKIITEHSFSDLLKQKKVYFFGDGAQKCKTMLAQQPNAIFIDHIFSSAASMISLAEEKFQAKNFEDVGLFEPFYLKEFTDGKKSNG